MSAAAKERIFMLNQIHTKSKKTDISDLDPMNALNSFFASALKFNNSFHSLSDDKLYSIIRMAQAMVGFGDNDSELTKVRLILERCDNQTFNRTSAIRILEDAYKHTKKNS